MDYVTYKLWNISFEEFSQLWIKTNYIKDLSDPGGYTYTENDDPGAYPCGEGPYGPLHEVPKALPSDDITNDTFTYYTGLVSIYGADYWVLNLNPALTDLKITLDGQEEAAGGNFSYHLISRKGDFWKMVAESRQNNVVWRRTLSPGEWDQAVLIVAGRSMGGRYKISIGSCMEGTWTDGFGYTWTLKEDLAELSGYVDTKTCGKYKVNGTYTSASGHVELTATRGNSPAGCCAAFSYVGDTDTCSVVTGTWSNPCGLTGDFQLTKSVGGTPSAPKGPEGDKPTDAH